MNNRTFSILLAAFLMALCGAASLFLRNNEVEDEPQDSAEAFVQSGPLLIFPVSGGRVTEGYGAVYDGTLMQWTGREEILLYAEPGTCVYAPMEGKVSSIGPGMDEGRQVTIAAGNIQAEIGPLTGLCVFEGSSVSRGAMIGVSQGGVYMKVLQDGKAVNPLDLMKEETG